jgi:hypothetical protein
LCFSTNNLSDLKMAGVAGRSGRRAESPFRDALRLALTRRDTEKSKALVNLANRLIDKAEEGDLQAIQEIANRLDGKPAQQLVHEGGDEPIRIVAVWGAVSDPDRPPPVDPGPLMISEDDGA